MPKYVKHIIVNLFVPFSSVMLVLTMVLLQLYSLKYINYVVSNGLDLLGFLKFLLLSVPSILSFIIPLSLFISICYGYNRLINEKEIIVFEASGLSKRDLIKPALIFALMVISFLIIVNFILAPISSEILNSKKNELKNNYFSGFFQEGVFNHPTQNVTIYVDKHENGSFKGVMIYDARNIKPTTIIAKSAKAITSLDKAPYFELVNGNRQQISQDKGLEVLYFDDFLVDFEIYQNRDSVKQKPINSYFLHELFFPNDQESVTKKNLMRIEAFHQVIWLVMTVILAFVASSFMLSGQHSRHGQTNRIVKASIMGAGFILLIILCKNFFSKSHSSVLSYVLLLIIFSAFVVFFTHNVTKEE